jgi:competence protein ComEA
MPQLSPSVPDKGKVTRTAPLLDLNTATFAQLRQLPGMGDTYVRRILADRPYNAKNQLLTRGVLPAPAYDLIKNLVVARHANGLRQ